MSLHTLLKLAAAVAIAGFAATGTVAVAIAAAGPDQESATTATGARAAVAPKSEAETIAEAFLKAGSALFDAKDAAALAATYTEDGEILLISKKDGEIQQAAKQGRASIEEFYRDLFREAGAIHSENTLEFSRLISPDFLVVHGRFRPDAGRDEIPFVQLRVKRGDRWLLSKLWLFLNP